MSSHSGGGGDLLSLICPELGVAPLTDPGTDVEDELSIPTSPLAVDSELERVFVDVGPLPKMVTPVGDPDGARGTTPARCPVRSAPEVSGCVVRPSMTSSPAGPDVGSPGFPHPPTGSVGLSHSSISHLQQERRWKSSCCPGLPMSTRLNRRLAFGSRGTLLAACSLLFP